MFDFSPLGTIIYPMFCGSFILTPEIYEWLRFRIIGPEPGLPRFSSCDCGSDLCVNFKDPPLGSKGSCHRNFYPDGLDFSGFHLVIVSYEGYLELSS